MEREEPNDENEYGLLNQKKYILKAKRTTAVEFDDIKENIRLKLEEDKEDRTKK